MLDKSGIIKRLMIADKKARNELDAWKDLEHPDPSGFAEAIYHYVLYKFLLDDEEELPDTRKLN